MLPSSNLLSTEGKVWDAMLTCEDRSILMGCVVFLQGCN